MKHKIGEKHHIATGHGLMVQGGLLTAHPGSAHCGGEAPRAQSSLWQGVGTGSSGCPDLGIAAAVEQRRSSRKEGPPEVLIRGVNIGQRGAPGGVPTTQAPSWRDQEGGRARWPPGRGCPSSSPP